MGKVNYGLMMLQLGNGTNDHANVLILRLSRVLALQSRSLLNDNEVARCWG
ncbi:hypothetical protein PPRY_b1032 [Pseudoalteromonas prydzensis ACAM 620]|jgi:hypothetical protein|nr:hypothetical protein [Pseudoalteromonas prydzensis ACAM 620]